MKKEIERRIKDALIFMQDEQLADGSFLSLSSPDITLQNGAVHKTTFTTSLILSGLENVRSDVRAEKIIRRGLRFLLHEKSADWSWNYWPRGGGKNKNGGARKIPDDMDDTFAALIALTIHKPDTIDPTALESILKNLQRTKHLLSGLHNTWIIDYRSHPGWDETDPVINSSIAYFLMRRGGGTAEIEKVLKTCLNEGFVSKYYSSPIVIFYLLSRLLGPQIIEKTKIPKPKNNALEVAMLLTALMRVEAPKKKLTPYIQKLMGMEWSAHGLYTESIKNKIPCHAGSEALTAAFCIEALAGYLLYENNPYE